MARTQPGRRLKPLSKAIADRDQDALRSMLTYYFSVATSRTWIEAKMKSTSSSDMSSAADDTLLPSNLRTRT
jgi:hypothetical protein